MGKDHIDIVHLQPGQALLRAFYDAFMSAFSERPPRKLKNYPLFTAKPSVVRTLMSYAPEYLCSDDEVGPSNSQLLDDTTTSVNLDKIEFRPRGWMRRTSLLQTSHPHKLQRCQSC